MHLLVSGMLDKSLSHTSLSAAGALDYRGSLRKYVVGTGKARSAAAARAKFKLGPIINYNR